MCVGRAMRQRPCSHTAPRLLVRTLTPTQGMRQSRPSPSASENLLGKSPASVNAPSLAEEVSLVLTHKKEYLFLFQSLNRKYILTILICPQRRFLQRKRKYICYNKQTLLTFTMLYSFVLYSLSIGYVMLFWFISGYSFIELIIFTTLVLYRYPAWSDGLCARAQSVDSKWSTLRDLRQT